jgi:hypothetical protein
MRATRLWALTALPFALAACGGGDDEAVEGGADTTAMGTMTDTTTAPMSTMPADTGMSAQGGGVTMNAVGSSGVTGQAQFMDQGGTATMVMVNLTAQGNSTHSGHIHTGTCDAPGDVVVPLEDVTLANGTGSSSSTIQVPLATVMNGQHIVAYHAGQGESAGAPVVCGAIPAMAAGGATAGTGTSM